MTSLKQARNDRTWWMGIGPPRNDMLAIQEQFKDEEDYESLARFPQGSSRFRFWQRKDGMWICYSTSSIIGGPHHGKFVTQAWAPHDRLRLTSVYLQFASTRKLARKRAERLYWKGK